MTLTDNLQTPARTMAEIHDLAALVPCGQCWQRPGKPCTITGAPGHHVARFARARRRGLLTEAEMAAVLAALDVITNAMIVRDGAR